MLRFRHVDVKDEAQILAGLKKNFDGRDGVNQMRLFRGGETPDDYVASIEFNSAAEGVELIRDSFGPLIKKLDLINTYMPYWRTIFHIK